MTARNLVILCALMVSACASADGGQSTPTTTTVESALLDCTDIADNARALATELRDLVTGASTMKQLQAADEPAGAVDEAKTSVGQNARAHFDDAGLALQQVQSSLSTEPVDWDGVRAGTDALVTALRDVASVCDAVPTS